MSDNSVNPNNFQVEQGARNKGNEAFPDARDGIGQFGFDLEEGVEPRVRLEHGCNSFQEGRDVCFKFPGGGFPDYLCKGRPNAI